MAWTLGSITLPNPQQFSRRFRDTETFHEAINGMTKRDITNTKEEFHIVFQKLPQATVASILSAKAQKQVLSFAAEQGDLSIAATDVHITVAGRDYNTKGSEFREDFTIILIEVQ